MPDDEPACPVSEESWQAMAHGDSYDVGPTDGSNPEEAGDLHGLKETMNSRPTGATTEESTNLSGSKPESTDKSVDLTDDDSDVTEINLHVIPADGAGAYHLPDGGFQKRFSMEIEDEELSKLASANVAIEKPFETSGSSMLSSNNGPESDFYLLPLPPSTSPPLEENPYLNPPLVELPKVGA